MNTTSLVLTCEHAGNEIPEKYKDLFFGYEDILSTHRGYDLGVLSLAEYFARNLKVKLYKTKTTRLLVDTNRSLWRRTLFSEITRHLSKQQKETILTEYYYPHRKTITEQIKAEIQKGQKVLHIAFHSFTPFLNSKERTAELGFLYNPERKNEKEISRSWKKEMKKLLPDWRLHFNYPYRGKPDGLTAHFRKMFPDEKYLGVELEVNQKFVSKDGSFPIDICNKIAHSFRSTVKEFSWL